MKVKEIMHKGVEWVPPETPIPALAQKMQQFDIGAIPIGENDRLIGMVTDRDICVRGVAKGKDISKLTARDVMTPGVVWCHDNEDAADAVRLMESKKIRRLPVIDDKKRMVGILTLGDVSHSESPQLTAEVTKAVSAHH